MTRAREHSGNGGDAVSLHDSWLSLVREIRKGAVAHARYHIARGMTIDHYTEVTRHNGAKGRGEGFSIFFGQWRIGWWETRVEACEDAEKIAGAIKEYPVDVGTGDA